jgi:GntR family transcriptional regulator, transcriptional repressor for pyruvate dehydrogenase complex
MTNMSIQFDSLKKRSLSQGVADEILRQIREGKLNVGDRLPPERRLCGEFGVSRTSLREGISSLTRLGILESRAGSGITVRNASPSAVLKNRLKEFQVDHDGLHDMVEFREGLETFIVELACEKAEPEDVRRLERRIVRMEKAEARGESLREEDVAFHRELTAAAHNEMAGIVFETISPYIDRWVRAREEIVGPRAAASVHRRIVDAVKRGDREAARSTMAGHFRHVRALIRAVEDKGG